MGLSDGFLAGLTALGGGALTMTDILGLPDETRAFFVWALQTGEFGASEVAARLDTDAAEGERLLARLMTAGVVKEAAVSGRFRMQVASKPARKVPDIWDGFSL